MLIFRTSDIFRDTFAVVDVGSRKWRVGGKGGD
jgi:hypothetical protein